MARTRKEIEQYVKTRKDNYIGSYVRGKKEFIYFYNRKGRFTGYIPKTRTSVSVIRKFAKPIKAKIKVKIKGERGKRTITYKIYNLKQRDQLLFRMNRKLRDKAGYKRKQRKRGLKDTKFREDAVPFIKGKKRIDLLFDKYELKPVIIEKFEGGS